MNVKSLISERTAKCESSFLLAVTQDVEQLSPIYLMQISFAKLRVFQWGIYLVVCSLRIRCVGMYNHRIKGNFEL